MPDQPLGPRKLDLAAQQPDDFEKLCHRLVLLEFPDAIAPQAPDGGADSLLPRPDGSWERAWQAKRYTDHIRWGACKESLDNAVKTWGIERMTFCFSRPLTKGQVKKFRTELVGRHPGICVDFWDLDQLLARLTGSEAGERVARHFFGPNAADPELMARAFRAGGPLDRSQSVFERGMPLAEHLAGHDPFFAYSAHQFEDGVTPTLTPGTAIAVTRAENGKRMRIDAVARDPDAARAHGPRLRIDFDPDERGQKAAQAVSEAVRRRQAVTVEDVTITAEQLPPLFADQIGQAQRAKITIIPQQIPIWGAVCHAESDRGVGEVRVDLMPMRYPPPGWVFGFRGSTSGLTLTIKARVVDERPQLNVEWAHRLENAPAHEQVHVLRLIDAIHGNGTLTVSDAVGGRPEFQTPTSARSFDLDGLLAVIEAVALIEERAGTEIPIPDEISATEGAWILTIAHAIETGELGGRWESLEIVANQEGLADHPSGGPAVIEQDMIVDILGQRVSIGRARLEIDEVEVHDLGPSDEESQRRLRLSPPGGQPIKTMWKLLALDDGGSGSPPAASK